MVGQKARLVLPNLTYFGDRKLIKNFSQSEKNPVPFEKGAHKLLNSALVDLELTVGHIQKHSLYKVDSLAKLAY